MTQKTSKGEKREMKKVRYISISLALITTLVLGIIIGKAQVFGSTIYIMGGIYPGAPTYTVWVDSGSYYAKNANGRVDFSGTDCSDLVSDVLDAMIASTVGAYRYLGVLHFGKGTFSFNTQIMKTPPVGVEACFGLIIEGEGRYTTNLRGIGAHPIFNFTGADRLNRFEAITIRNLEISSDALIRSAGNHALIFVNATFSNIYDCYIYNAYDSGIYMSGLETDFIHDNGIYGNRGIGIEINGELEVHISNNNIYGNGLDGIRASNTAYIDVATNFIAANLEYGVYYYGTHKSAIAGNNICVNARDGIVFVGAGNNTITGNVVFENGNESTNTYSGIRLGDSLYNIISDNRVFDEGIAPYQQWGIEEEGTSDYNIIVSCSTINGGATGGIKMAIAEASSHSRVAGSYNLSVWVLTWGLG